MNNFLTWEVLLTFSGLVGAVYMVVEFTKEIPIIKKIPTKYWSWIITLILLIATNLVLGSFSCKNIILYMLNSIVISLSSNGLSDFNKGDENMSKSGLEQIEITGEVSGEDTEEATEKSKGDE